jgi:hypothetical protein
VDPAAAELVELGNTPVVTLAGCGDDCARAAAQSARQQSPWTQVLIVNVLIVVLIVNTLQARGQMIRIWCGV